MNNKSVHSEAGPSQHRKSKKKSSRRSSSTVEAWHNNDSQEASEDEAPAMEYTSVYWQQPRLPQPQPCPAPNGQRLFTAMSDPSVCGYSAVPITYTMEPVSLPPMYQLFQPVVRPNYRTYRGRTRTALRRMQTGPPSSSDAMVNGYSSLQENSWNHSVPVGYQNGDYASLPPTANTDNKDNGEELNSEHRRYSDPGLKPALVPNNAKSDNSDSADSDSSITTIEKNSKLISTFIDQMTKMKEANSQLFKELHEAKTELEIVKTELNQYKQNVHSDYKPGMLSDVIKEIRDASRIKEEAMLSKVKLLIENQQSQRSADLEQFKNQLDRVWKEKEQNEQRIEKLEKEVTALRLNVVDNGEIVAFEEENLALRRELEEARASRNYAESHATKCVDAAVALGTLTPVNFDSPYSPCITSTPVRTTFESISTDPTTSSVASLRSTDANHDFLDYRPRRPASLSPVSSPDEQFRADDSDQTIVAFSDSQDSGEQQVRPTSQDLLPKKRDYRSDHKSDGDSPEAQEDPIATRGNSVVSKDLGSTNILTSRTQNSAPSRATYTTSYI